MNDLDFSPKLKNAMEEIKQVLKKHDIGGLIILHTPGYGEHYIKLSPSYSALELTRKGVIMRAKGKSQETIENSLNLLKIIIDLGLFQIYPLMGMSKKMDEYYSAEYDKGKHTGHDQLFN